MLDIENFSVAIVGSTGYTGKKLIQLVSAHPFITNYTLYGNDSAGKNLYEVFPEFESIIPDQVIENIDELSDSFDAYFFCLPHGHAMHTISELSLENKIVIDLSADFRLKDHKIFHRTYGEPHSAPNLLAEFGYGLCDWKSHPTGNLIANPGCYPTAALLSLLPLVSNITNDILSVSVTAYSGTSGAGKKAAAELLLSEMDGNARAYQIHAHRHEPEILQALQGYGFNSPFNFTTHLLPADVGIYSTSSVFLKKIIPGNVIYNFFDEAYKNSSFVRIRKTPPQLSWVKGTNFCDIHVSVRGNSILVAAAIDNLIKGAAGQAMQNLNRLMGWPETTGFLNREVVHDDIY